MIVLSRFVHEETSKGMHRNHGMNVVRNRSMSRIITKLKLRSLRMPLNAINRYVLSFHSGSEGPVISVFVRGNYTKEIAKIFVLLEGLRIHTIMMQIYSNILTCNPIDYVGIHLVNTRKHTAFLYAR